MRGEMREERGEMRKEIWNEKLFYIFLLILLNDVEGLFVVIFGDVDQGGVFRSAGRPSCYNAFFQRVAKHSFNAVLLKKFHQIGGFNDGSGINAFNPSLLFHRHLFNLQN